MAKINTDQFKKHLSENGVDAVLGETSDGLFLFVTDSNDVMQRVLSEGYERAEVIEVKPVKKGGDDEPSAD